MSFTSHNRKLRAGLGKGFPLDPGADTEAIFAEVIAQALDEDFGRWPSKAKHLARLTGANERTVQNWLLGRNGPSGAGLVVLMRHSEAVARAVLCLADRPEFAHAASLNRLRRDLRLAVTAIVDWLGPDET